MDKLVIDSWAWAEYLRGSEAGRKIRERISHGGELWTSVVSLTEIVSKYRREGLPEQTAVEAIGSLSRFGTPDRGDAVEAGRIHAEVSSRSPNFGLADSVLQLARKVGAKVLTGDPHFEGLEEAEFVGS
jgi:predicted nucleic acid-binding protein